jgi:hypothetical protein
MMNKRHRFISKGAEHEFSRPAEMASTLPGMASTLPGIPRNASALADTGVEVAATFGRDLERAVAQLASNASALLDSALGRLPDVAAQVRAACRCRRSFTTILLSLFIACSGPRAPARADEKKDHHAPDSDITTFQAAAPVIRSVRENARGLVADVLRDAMWPALAVLLVSHVLSALAVLCLLRAGAALRTRCALAAPALAAPPRHAGPGSV